MYRLQATAYPTQRPGQLDIGTQIIGRGLSTRGLLDGYDDLLKLMQGACEATGKTIGEQTEGTVPLGAVPTRNPGSGRIDPRVGAMARKRATAARVQRTALEGCIVPGLMFNVFNAGEVDCEAKLHRPPARTAATVAGHSSASGNPLQYEYGRFPAGHPPAGERTGKSSHLPVPLYSTATTSQEVE